MRKPIKQYIAKIKRDLYGILANEQNHKCAICNKSPVYGRHKYPRKLAIDHNHKTGKIRGLLCRYCNLALGGFKDNIKLLKKAIEYLEEYS